ncbi:MAG: hypothetical protein R2827_07935 [Bdellovibrionales bacterium]
MTTWTGPLVRHLRLRLGWSQSELGRRLGLSLQAMMALEKSLDCVDQELFHQLDYLKDQTDSYSERHRQRPQLEKHLKEKNLSQVDTGRSIK